MYIYIHIHIYVTTPLLSYNPSHATIACPTTQVVRRYEGRYDAADLCRLRRLLSLGHGTDYDDFSEHYTTHYTRLFNHRRNNIYSMCNWCKHQINRKEHICKSRSRLSLRTRRGPNPEQPFVSVTTMFLPYRSTLLSSSRQAPPSATCACHSPVPPQGYARSGRAHRVAPDNI